MSDSINVPLEVLKQVSALLKRLTPQQIEGLVDGSMRLACEPTVKRRASASLEIPDAEKIRADLSSMNSSEEGHDYVEELGLTRERLRHLASALDLHVPRSDTAEKMKGRIVEATIGYRLRSEAIRGQHASPVDPPEERSRKI
jgi:hypothetical protein